MLRKVAYGSNSEKLAMSTTGPLNPGAADPMGDVGRGLRRAISGIMLCNKSRVDDAGTAHSITLIGRG
jgi:hypothetical protein